MKSLLTAFSLLGCSALAGAQQIARDTLRALDDTSGLESVTVTTTRSGRTIRDIPTRIEVIGGEELEEKANMKPGDIRMLLSESTGIQTQQTSATSANAAIRIQGLDGRYTQILKDGFPVFAGAASGLGLLQTPPLDLRQVEIVKGSSSTLYGGGAIAGLVNLVSKTPGPERELRLHGNATSAGGLDLNGFWAQRFGRFGITLLASRNSNAPYDPAGIGLSAIPRFTRYVLHPKFFWYPSARTTVSLALGGTTERRTGGDMQLLRGEGSPLHQYYEQNDTRRGSAQLTVDHRTAQAARLLLKSSYSYFRRQIATPGYHFEGAQHLTYSEASYSRNGDAVDAVIGLTLLSDAFRERPGPAVSLRDYTQVTAGAFAQAVWKPYEWLSLEGGLRADHVFGYGTAVLPRLAMLLRAGPKLSSRIGGGLGYKAPTIFTEESERIQYRNVLPVNAQTNRLERSYGANADVNYRTALGRFGISVNQLFFYTRIEQPLLLTPDGPDFRFVSSAAHIDSRGAETNVKLSYGDWKLFLGYTFTDAYVHTGEVRTEQPLTPQHRVNSVLTYEIEARWKLGAEAYYYSPQRLGDGSIGRGYWLCGLMAERSWSRVSVYVNLENFLDVRQTRFESIYTGTLSSPQFRDIYAPLDGFVYNGGVKWRL